MLTLTDESRRDRQADDGDAFTGVVHVMRLGAPDVLSNGLIVLLYLESDKLICNNHIALHCAEK